MLYWTSRDSLTLHVSIQKPDLGILEYSQPSQLSEELIKLTSIKDSATHPSVSLPAPRLTLALRRSEGPSLRYVMEPLSAPGVGLSLGLDISGDE